MTKHGLAVGLLVALAVAGVSCLKDALIEPGSSDGGSTSHSSAPSSGTGGASCVLDCATECSAPTCVDGKCVAVPYAPNVVPPNPESDGTCFRRVCDGDGGLTALPVHGNAPSYAQRGSRCFLDGGLHGFCDGEGVCLASLPCESNGDCALKGPVGGLCCNWSGCTLLKVWKCNTAKICVPSCPGTGGGSTGTGSTQ